VEQSKKEYKRRKGGQKIKKMKNNGRINEVGYGENLGKNKSLY